LVIGKRLWLLITSWIVSTAFPAFPQEILFHNELTFYDEQAEFNGPYRNEESLFGQQIKSLFKVVKGSRTEFEAGVFADHPSAMDPSFQVQPLLTFEYHSSTTRLLFGTLDSQDRHGYLEPLEAEDDEITRPVEYGLQWIEEEDHYRGDFFLNWQKLNIVDQPEVFDYGFVAKGSTSPTMDLELQFHGHHEGGKLYFIHVINNYVPALGIKAHGDLGPLGEGSFGVFALASSDFEGQFITGPDWGRGLYAKGVIHPGGWFGIYGIYWNGRNFYSEEGDNNYNSQGLEPAFYRTDRIYEELGLSKTITDDKSYSIEAELRSHWMDEFWAYSARLVARVALDVEVPLKEKNSKKDGATDVP
jgi:hypothetical protein